MKKCFALLVLATSLSYSAASTAADEKTTPLKTYDQKVAFSLLHCSILHTTYLLNGDFSVFRKCVDDGKSAIKQAYGNAAKTVKKAAAKTALKEHYITVMSSLQGIQAQDEETKMNYEKRQGDNNTKREEKWIRFEAEAEN